MQYRSSRGGGGGACRSVIFELFIFLCELVIFPWLNPAFIVWEDLVRQCFVTFV
jgi:hypothetical protein